MENKMMKFYSRESNMVAIHAIPGHFATSHSHINYYIDITSLKTRIKEAKELAKVLCSKIGQLSYVDTIVCMDGTEVIGAFLADEFEKGNFISTNQHETIYVVAPELNSSNQIIFRDNIKPSIYGKHVILLLATTTTGKTIRRSAEGIRYYGGIVESVVSVFGTVDKVDDMPVVTVFSEEDLPGYKAYAVQDCPFCKQGQRLEAMVNGFGYSKF
ncbi:MAG: orotate phosphoribosyltransferase [Roseburia sp.]|nr:orotate phosphoribosyltransferase [Roseburia sp.]